MNKKTGLLWGLILVGVAPAQADRLPPLTVLAKKFESPKEKTSSVVDLITGEELKRMQENRLLDALRLIPGTQGLSTAGQTGNIGSVLIRGLSTKYVQVVVDGVRLTDAASGAGNFLGAGNLGGITQLEILRGPQSVLYGSGASGGVVGYETALGESGNFLLAEAGNLGTQRASLLSKGEMGGLRYAVSLGMFETDNDPSGGLLQHDYQQQHGILALEGEIAEGTTVRFSYRGSGNELATVSDFGFGASPALIETNINLLALNVNTEITPFWNSRVTLGYYDEVYDADFGGFPVVIDYDRRAFNWGNEFDFSDEFTLQAGAEFADSYFENNSGRSIDYRTLAVYLNGVWELTERLFIEGGIRYEDHNAFDSDLAWNLGAVYEVTDKLKIRGRLAESYRTPTLLESEAFTPAFGARQVANPNLESEEIFGGEIGVEYEKGEHLFAVTYFHQCLENAIVPGNATIAGATTSYQNVNLPGTSDVSGFEVSASGQLNHLFDYRVALTKQLREEVLDVPDFQVDADIFHQGDGWLAGLAVSYLDEARYGLAPFDSRFLTRIYGELEVEEGLILYGRVENLFDEHYTVEPFLQAEGLGRSFVIGARLEW